MARAGCKTNGLQKIEGDDIEKSLEVLDKVLLEFEDPDSLPHIEPESPSQGNQSEDDGYMSMNGRRAKTSLDFHQPSDESSSASPPVTDTLHVNTTEVGETKRSMSPPPPEVAEAIISNLLPRASPTVTMVTIGESLNTDGCEKIHNARNLQTQPNWDVSANVTTLSFVSSISMITADNVQDTGGGKHCSDGGGGVGVGGVITESTTPLQTTLPKARPSSAIPSRYASLPCSGPPKGSSDSIIRGISSGSFDDGRNVLGMGISAVHDAVLRGSVARLPEPIVNEHPVTIYPGRESPPRTTNRVPPRTLPGSFERHREVCRNINSNESCGGTADNVDCNLMMSPLKLLAVTKSPSSPLVSGQQHFIRNIKSSHQLFDSSKNHLSNLLMIPPRKQNGEDHHKHKANSDSEEFSDDSLEGQSLPPPPPPPVVPPPPSLSAPVTPSKRGSIAWEINLDDHLPPPPPLQLSSHQATSSNKKKYKGKLAPLEISSSSAKIIARRRGRSISGSQSSLGSTPGNSIGSATSNRCSPQYQLGNKFGSMEWPEPPDPPVCTTEDEAASIYSDSDEIVPNYPINLTGKGTYVIRKGRRERNRISEMNAASMSSSINSRLSSEGNLSTGVVVIQNSNLFMPKSRHSIDLGSSSHTSAAVHNPILSPRSRLSLDLSSQNSTSELPQTTVTAIISNNMSAPQQQSSPRFQELKSFNSSLDALQIYESNGNDGGGGGGLNGPHSSNSSLNNNNNNSLSGSLTRVSSLPTMPQQSCQNEPITTPRRELAPPIEEDEEQDSESQRGAPLRQIENNISALLRGDIVVARVGDITSHPRRPLGFRPGVHKSESAKEMLLSQTTALGPLPPSPPSSSPEPEIDGFPPLPPSPQENVADDEEETDNDILRGLHGIRVNSRTRLKNELLFSRDSAEHPPAVPPHRIQPSLNTLKTRSMDAGYSKKYSSTSPHGTGPGTLPGELPITSSRRRLMSGAFPKRSAQSPREEKRLQTSCSLPETPIFARGCDIPRTPHRRAPEVPNGGSRTAPRTNTTSSLGSSIVGIGSTLGGGRQRSISQALASGEMLRLAGGPARGWYPKQRNMRPASTEHLDRLHRSQGSIRAWDSGGGIPISAGPGGSRKPLTLPPNLTPKFFNKSPREALRRVTSLLIRKGNGKDKESKREKDTIMTSAVHRSPGSAGNVSYLSKTICEELIELMSQEVRAAILAEIRAAGYFSLSVDSTPDLSHIDQLCVIIRYVSPFDDLPVERFLTFLELKSHVGKDIADAVLKFLIEDCKLDFSKCRGQSYDNAANMSGIYKGMQSIILQLNPYAIYIACAAHSLNLVGRSAVDCCLEAVNFFSLVQTVYVFFSASTQRWKVLKDHIKDEKVLKKLSNTRWEAHAVATDAILKSYPEILDALDSISEDKDQKGETRQEAMNIAKKMQEFEFVFMVTMWNDILHQFHRTSQALQNAELNLQVCSDLYKTLTFYLLNLRERFDEFENKSKEILPDGDYRGNGNRRRTRRVQVNDGPAEDAVLSARDKFRVSTFYFIVDILQVEMKTRGEVYEKLADKFSFLLKMDLSNDELFAKVESLVASYPEDLNSNLADELQQFHQYVRLKMEKDQSISANFTDFYKIIVNDQLQTVFPNLEICFRIFLSLMITNCSGERSFSQLKRIKNPLRTTMRQDRLCSLALLCIESDVMRRMNFDKLIEDFARQKCRKKKV